jgi:hypothetical protein
MRALTPWIRLRGSARMRIEWKAADLWIGAYWSRDKDIGCVPCDLWVCALPCLPLHFAWEAE